MARNLGKEFPYGIVVVHDDVNQLADGTRSAEAEFKIVSLEKVLGRNSGLLDVLDTEWDPRA